MISFGSAMQYKTLQEKLKDKNFEPIYSSVLQKGSIKTSIPLSSRILRCVSRAMQSALTSDMKSHHGCAVFSTGGSKFIASASNNIHRSSLLGKHYVSMHAEIAALYKAFSVTKHYPKQKSRAKPDFFLVSVRVSPEGLLVGARPCKHCLQFMMENGIKYIYYSTNDQDIVCENVAAMEGYTSTGFLSLYQKRLVKNPDRPLESFFGREHECCD